MQLDKLSLLFSFCLLLIRQKIWNFDGITVPSHDTA